MTTPLPMWQVMISILEVERPALSRAPWVCATYLWLVPEAVLAYAVLVVIGVGRAYM